VPRCAVSSLLCLGKNDFEAITGFREDVFFHEALGVKQVPSEGILRQRMDAHADAYRTAVVDASLAFLSNVRAPVTPLANGYDAIENTAVISAHNEQHGEAAPAHYIIKWNPRQESPEQWLADAEAHAEWVEPRPGKRVAVFDVRLTRTHGGYDYPLRRVMRVTERSIDKHGQQLLVPEIELEGWWTSLWQPCEEIIALYADHATSEQFHSELKTDLDVERLPSGKFATNALVLACAQLAYNLLRWLGQVGLLGPDAPPRRKAKRRRLRTAMQELMYVAARLIRTGRRLKLAFG
jgi:hypothetical protein